MSDHRTKSTASQYRTLAGAEPAPKPKPKPKPKPTEATEKKLK